MSRRKLAGAVAATAMVLGVGAIADAPAWATDNIKPFGELERLNDSSGASTIGYTVRDLVPSSDPVAHSGQLYEATVTVAAYGSPATPSIAQFGARAENRALYRALTNAPGGLSGAPVPPGGSATGKLYFDVVGQPPQSVVYGDGLRDLLAWVPGPPEGGTRP